MHPAPVFHADAGPLLAEAERIGFAHVFVQAAPGPMVVHVPVTLHDGALRFHVARANRIAAHLDGAAVAVSIAGPHGYVSPNWYAAPADRVPTWNYVSIEVDGRAYAIDEAATIAQLDRMAAVHEPVDAPWHRAKTDPALFARLLAGIRGFEVTPAAVRGTTKLSQNVTAADRDGVIAELRRAGNAPLADAMATHRHPG
jgi:transcriptional regulator